MYTSKGGYAILAVKSCQEGLSCLQGEEKEEVS